MLTKSQVLQDIIIDLAGDEDPKVWDYISSVIIKQVVNKCSPQEKQEFKKLLNQDNQEQIDTFIIDRIDPVMPDIQKEIGQFSEALQNKILNE